MTEKAETHTTSQMQAVLTSIQGGCEGRNSGF